MKQLDSAINSSPVQPSVIKSLETKIEVLSKMVEREEEAKKCALEARLTEAQGKLATYSGINPNEIQEQADENRTLRAQLENVRASNQSYASEIAAERAKSSNLAVLLSWVTSRANPERKTAIAIDCFVVHGTTGQPLIDALTAPGTTAEWGKLSASKQRLVDAFKQCRRATNPTDIRTREFARTLLAKKFDCDIERVLAVEAESVRQQQEDEAKRHEQAVFQRDLSRNRQRRENAREAQIRAAENGQFSPASVIEQW